MYSWFSLSLEVRFEFSLFIVAIPCCLAVPSCHRVVRLSLVGVRTPRRLSSRGARMLPMFGVRI